MPFQVILAIILIIIAYKYGDWRNWKLYYDTILFFGFGDLMYRFLFDDRLLWAHRSVVTFLTDNQIELIWILVIYPCIVLLFLPCCLTQKSLLYKIGYFFIWIISFSVIELALYSLGCISYENGWSYYHSVVFYFFMFPILVLHHHKPLLAILSSIFCCIALMLIFRGSIMI